MLHPAVQQAADRWDRYCRDQANGRNAVIHVLNHSIDPIKRSDLVARACEHSGLSAATITVAMMEVISERKAHNVMPHSVAGGAG